MHNMICHMTSQTGSLQTADTSSVHTSVLMQNANIDSVFQRGRTIQNILSANGAPPTSKKEDPAGAVYHIQCDCGDSYVGETSRPLPIRIKEHKTSVQKNDSKSTISDHTQTHPDHNIQWNNIKILANNQSDVGGLPLALRMFWIVLPLWNTESMLAWCLSSLRIWWLAVPM
ncbi:uncharacterized protein LOC125372369 [Haliotis rufescens]|uniref:uncharacterized protein LOC125372369 n=1 Tax=Haliotis rufescens TaxID=6454 RepID=UPI00201FA558|nr:uncharacterized protein LOC125372369 [Haliotis rufescens]